MVNQQLRHFSPQHLDIRRVKMKIDNIILDSLDIENIKIQTTIDDIIDDMLNKVCENKKLTKIQAFIMKSTGFTKMRRGTSKYTMLIFFHKRNRTDKFYTSIKNIIVLYLKHEYLIFLKKNKYKVRLNNGKIKQFRRLSR